MLLPRCSALCKLVLVDFTCITEEGWEAFAECSRTLQVLKLVDVPYASDEQMAKVLEKACKLEKLVLRNLVALRGECLKSANFSLLRDLRQVAFFSGPLFARTSLILLLRPQTLLMLL